MRAKWVLVLVLVATVLAACGDDDDVVTTVTASPATTAVVATTTAPTTTALPADSSGVEVAVDAGSLADAPAADLSATQGVLLFEDFQDGQATGWDVGWGWFVFGSADSLAFTASDDAWAWFPPGENWSKYVVRLAARIDAGDLAISWDVSAAGRYLVHLNEDGVYLLEDRPWGTFTTLASAAPVTMGAWHVITVGRDDGHIQVYLDGDLWIDHFVTDPLPAGTIGLGSLPESAVVVDNVLVTALLRPFPPGNPVAAAEPAPDQLEPEPPPAMEDPLEPGDSDTEAHLPNLSIESVRFDRDSYRVGEYATVEIDVHVTTALAGPIEVVMLHLLDPFCERTFGDVGGEETVTITCTTPVFEEEGAFPWWVHVDPGDDIPENESHDDNSAMGELAIGPAQVAVVGDDKPDLEFVDFSLNPWEPEVGQDIVVWAEVAQTNDAWQGDLPPFEVVAGVGPESCVWTPDPAVGPAWSLECVVPGIAEAGQHSFTFTIDPANVVDELVEDSPFVGRFEVVETFGGREVDLEADPDVYWGWPHPGGAVTAGETVRIFWGWFENTDGPLLTTDFTAVFEVRNIDYRCEQVSRSPRLGTSCEVVFPGPGTFRWRVRIDTTDALTELDENNNSVQGDITVVAP